MTFVHNFLKNIALPIGDLARWLEIEHKIPLSTTMEKWNELTGMKITTDNSSSCAEKGGENFKSDSSEVVENMKNLTKTEVKERVKSFMDQGLVDTGHTLIVTQKSKDGPLDPLLCQHVFIAGRRKGQQCFIKPNGGKDRCSSHKIKIRPEP
jgi:hypothetical protein